MGFECPFGEVRYVFPSSERENHKNLSGGEKKTKADKKEEKEDGKLHAVTWQT